MRAASIVLAAAIALSSPAAAELDLDRAEVTHLQNGLTVIMLEDRSFPVVSVQMLYKSGSAAEVSGKTGLAHFMEHLAFRGSRNFPAGRATELIYDSGGEWHGYTAMDQTTYFSTMPRDGLDLLLRIEADRMARTIIDPASIEAEKGAVITELHSYEND
ncbi:MAG TPA: insulinase family protein, partial [Sphingomicrobium sp.]|nr:insulinase family protein [Sphingomicrobium sp.]